MRKHRQLLCCTFALAVLLWALSGCNTWAGLGKDIQRGGEAIENSAE